MKNLLGSNPLTTVAGFIVAGLMVAQEMMSKGETSWLKIGIAVSIAVLGRLAGDTTNTK